MVGIKKCGSSSHTIWSDVDKWVGITLMISIVITIILFAGLLAHELQKVGGKRVITIYLSDTVEPNPDGDYYPLQYTEEDFYFMQQALYYEAQNEPLECQEMVAHVIMARKYDWFYPNTIRDVVWQSKQFSYTHDGKSEGMGDDVGEYVAGKVAHQVLSGLSLDRSSGSLYYHNPKLVDWKYKKDYTFVTSCGQHDFYKRKETKKWS